MTSGPDDFAAAFDVSRETMDRLRILDELLLRWTRRINLIGNATIADRWRRHFADSAQLAAHLPEDAKTLVDLGAGAGFPGLVLAAMRGQLQATLLESDARKAAFLQSAIRETGVNAVVRAERIERVEAFPRDVIVSRALAPLPRLLGYARRFAAPGTVCLFHKGAAVESELTEARLHWHIRCVRHPSVIDPGGAILEIREFDRLHGK